MLYFIVAFITFCVFKHWNPMFSPVIHSLDDSCPTRYSYHYTSTTYHNFPNLWHLYDVATSHNTQNPNPGCITHKPSYMCHNPGRMTHNDGRLTQSKSYVLSIQHHNSLIYDYNTGHMTHNLGCMTQSKSYVLSIQHHNCLISETGVSTVSVYNILYYSNSQIDEKFHSINKCSVLPLFLAFYRTIYYLLNSNFNQAYDVNHLINRLLLMLQRYITRCNDF